MLGFTAVGDPDAEPRPADGELDDVRWFTRDELRAAASWGGGPGLQLPGAISIARHLVDHWLNAPAGG
jgi:NAD+ diphosphatase